MRAASKRVLALLCAWALMLAPVSAQHLGLLGAGSVPAAGGGTVTFDVAIDASDGIGSTTLNSADFTIANVSGRFALAGMMTRDYGTPATHTRMEVEGATMTQQGTTAVIGPARGSRHSLIGPANGTLRTLTGVISDADSTFLIAGVVYNGVNQTTPINSTATPDTATLTAVTSINRSITVTTVTNGKAVVVLFLQKPGNTEVPTVTPGTGVTVRTSEYLVQEGIYILERDNNGGSTVVACTLSWTTASDADWRMDGYGIQP